MAEDWKIHRSRAACDRPGCPLPSSAAYYAVLEWAPVPAGGGTACVRRDLCDACFFDYAGRRAGNEPAIFWRALRRAAGSREPVLDLQSLRSLFDRLAAVDDQRARALRYFCALLLLRKRVLRMVPPRTEEQQRADLVVADPKDKDMPPIALFAPAIDFDDLTSIKDELLAAIGENAAAADDRE